MPEWKLGNRKKSRTPGNLASIRSKPREDAVYFERVPVLELASGDTFTIPVYTVYGTKPGAPTAYLQSAAHGSEVQGSLVIALLLEHLRKNPPLGNVRLVPNANPMGLNNKRGDYTDGRFDAVTGDNFNRKYHLPTKDLAWERFLKVHQKASAKELAEAFRSEMRQSLQTRQERAGFMAERLALQLQLLSIDYDHCLDLHCANHSVRHVYAPEHTKADVPYFQIPNVILIPDDEFGGAKDEVFSHPWAELARRRGRPNEVHVQSFTLELGDQEAIERKGAEKDLAGILSYLAHRGVLKGRGTKGKPRFCKLEKYATIHAPRGGLAEWTAKPGDYVKEGQVVARMLHFAEEPSFNDVKSPVSGVITVRHSSSIMLEGAELMKVIQVEL